MQTKTDAELLKSYAEHHDSAAFAELVTRHGAMVYHVCFRVLANQHEAEDASQAAFMTLAGKASRIRVEGTVANWLHTVARQAALTLRRMRINRLQRESAAAEMLAVERGEELGEPGREAVLRILDEELAALSAAQREAVILRHLQGRSEKEAAAMVGCAANTLSRRAFNGISRLRLRLARRGCALGIPALVGVLEAESQAAIPQTLIPSLMAVPKLMTAGASAGAGAGNLMAVMEGTMRALFMGKMKVVGVGVIAAVVLGMAGVVAVKEVRKGVSEAKGELKPCIALGKTAVNQGKTPIVERQNARKKPVKPQERKDPVHRDFPAEADRALKAMKEKDFTSIHEVLVAWGREDHEAAVRWATELPDEVVHSIDQVFLGSGGASTEEITRSLLMSQVALGWAEVFPAAAAQWVEQLSAKGRVREIALSVVSSSWARSDLPSAVDWAERLPEGNDRNEAMFQVATAWAERDLAAAARWADRLPAGEGRNRALSQIAVKWTETPGEDPDAAALLVDRLSGKARDRALSEVVGALANKEPKEALRLAELLPEGKIRDQALSRIAGRLAEIDPEEAVQLVDRLPGGELRERAVMAMASRWAKVNSESAAQWVERLPEGRGSVLAVVAVVARWAEKDSDAALQWVEKLPDGEGRTLALVEIALLRPQSDPAELVVLAQSLPEGENRNVVLLRVGSMWAERDPDAAARWAEQLSDGEIRNEVLSSVINQWGRKDPASAVKWVRQSSIPQAVRADMLKKLEKKEP